MTQFCIRTDNYRGVSRDGLVVNMLTDEPRLFPTEVKAREYAKLSLFRGVAIEEYKH